jgi:hypothetical protein
MVLVPYYRLLNVADDSVTEQDDDELKLLFMIGCEHKSLFSTMMEFSNPYQDGINVVMENGAK